jgi:hypothetical protein
MHTVAKDVSKARRSWGAPRVATASRALIVTLCLVVHGCADVEGGAVELSWKLRAATGASEAFLSCNVGLPGTGRITHIRLDWEVGEVRAFRQWRCEDDHGVTGFELPEGSALLRVSPVCADGEADPATYSAPAPEHRRMIAGNTVSLGGVELLLEVSSCDRQACICQPPATEVARGHTKVARSLP